MYAVNRDGDLSNLIPVSEYTYRTSDLTYDPYYDDYYYRWVTHTGYKDPAGNTYEEKSSSSKDLESMGANIETERNSGLSSHLESNYGLSADRAQEVAKVTTAFNKIQNKRSVTDREKSYYTKSILGVDYAAGKAALEKHLQGESSDLENLMEIAAYVGAASYYLSLGRSPLLSVT